MAKTKYTEAEFRALEKYKGLTRRAYNAKHSKFANHTASAVNGSFEVVALFEGNPVEQTAPFPNELAALSRFERLSSNPNVLSLKVVQNVPQMIDGKPTGLRRVALYSLTKSGQEFANSRREILWKQKGGNSVFTEKAIWQSANLTKLAAAGELEVHKFLATGGNAWWEARA